MKVTQATPAFQPVNILIESEAEIKLLANLVACTCGNVSEIACGDSETSYAVWRQLSKYADIDITSKIDISTTD